MVIVMANAGQSLARAAAAARPGGLAVSPLGGPKRFPREVNTVYAGTAAAQAGQLDLLAHRVVEGTLRVPVGADSAFTDARQALIDLHERHIQGKITITF
ncbi:hypothetical protein [Nonomuraea sp. NPDC052265]|uniref:hypothetical protein n=1 Tax=Nonomuraea sp. NPDC052265 TaxID=3364374 RepID=UPI0037C82C32